MALAAPPPPTLRGALLPAVGGGACLTHQPYQLRPAPVPPRPRMADEPPLLLTHAAPKAPKDPPSPRPLPSSMLIHPTKRFPVFPEFPALEFPTIQMGVRQATAMRWRRTVANPTTSQPAALLAALPPPIDPNQIAAVSMGSVCHQTVVSRGMPPTVRAVCSCRCEPKKNIQFINKCICIFLAPCGLFYFHAGWRQ